MIPTLILFGALLGRWWWFTLAAAAIGWPLILVGSGVMELDWALAAAAALGAANALVGVLLYQLVAHGYRLARRLDSRRHSDEAPR